jgi:curved DNA-binding protein CbpA
MAEDLPDYYAILQVDPEAEPEVIEAAYRRLARKYHPDVNPAPDASQRMVELNAAYAVLGDPEKRAAYDRELGFQEVHDRETIDSYTYAESFARSVRCQGCGAFDHTLRVVAFPYVFSILIVSFKRSSAGIFCDSCRASQSTKWAVISLLFGIWGFPFGIFWTIESLVVNLRKGKVPKDANQQLLEQLAWANLLLGRIGEAKAALRDLLKYGANEKARQLKDELDMNYPTVSPKRVSGFRYGFMAVVLAILAMYGFVGNAIFGGSSETSGTVNSPPAKSAPVATPRPVPIVSPDKSYVKWRDASDWINETTVKISGTVRNTHSQWSIASVKIDITILNRYGGVVEQHTVSVAPSTISPGRVAFYIKTLPVPDSGEKIERVLKWRWVPPPQ